MSTTDGIPDKKSDKRQKEKKPTKAQADELNPQTDALQKEFNKELEKIFLKDNQ